MSTTQSSTLASSRTRWTGGFPTPTDPPGRGPGHRCPPAGDQRPSRTTSLRPRPPRTWPLCATSRGRCYGPMTVTRLVKAAAGTGAGVAGRHFRTAGDTPTPPACCGGERTSTSSSACSATPTSPPRRGTCTCRTQTSPTAWTRRSRRAVDHGHPFKFAATGGVAAQQRPQSGPQPTSPRSGLLGVTQLLDEASKQRRFRLRSTGDRGEGCNTLATSCAPSHGGQTSGTSARTRRLICFGTSNTTSPSEAERATWGEARHAIHTPKVRATPSPDSAVWDSPKPHLDHP